MLVRFWRMVKLLLDRCKAPFDDLPKSVITMHLVVQPSPTKARPCAYSLWFLISVHLVCSRMNAYVLLKDKQHKTPTISLVRVFWINQFKKKNSYYQCVFFFVIFSSITGKNWRGRISTNKLLLMYHNVRG